MTMPGNDVLLTSDTKQPRYIKFEREEDGIHKYVMYVYAFECMQ